MSPLIQRNGFRFIALAVALLIGSVGVGGCETTQNSGASDGGPSSGDQMLAHYEAGRYRDAYELAVEQTRRGSISERDRARYIAGVSAFQLGRHTEALRYLRPLSTRSDEALAGRANATIALAYVHRKDNERAVEYFQRAVRQLKGEDQAHAYYHLALAQQRLGQWTQARTSLSHAMSRSRDADFRSEVQQRIQTTGFTIQLGAFSSRSNAERRARTARSAASSIGTPRVIPSTADDGSRLYLVQVGNFSTYDSALQARRRLGRTDAVVTVISQ